MAETNERAQRLIWIDLEMTGLEPERDRIIEVATIVTDADLNTIAEGPVLAVHQPEAVMEQMDEWNTITHGNSGLTQRVRESSFTERDAEQETIAFLKEWVDPRTSPSAATVSARTAAFWPGICRNWKPFSTTATWT